MHKKKIILLFIGVIFAIGTIYFIVKPRSEFEIVIEKILKNEYINAKNDLDITKKIQDGDFIYVFYSTDQTNVKNGPDSYVSLISFDGKVRDVFRIEKPYSDVKTDGSKIIFSKEFFEETFIGQGYAGGYLTTKTNGPFILAKGDIPNFKKGEFDYFLGGVAQYSNMQ